MPNSTNEKCKTSKVENDANVSAQYLKSLSVDIIDAKAAKVLESSSYARPDVVLKLCQSEFKYTGDQMRRGDEGTKSFLTPCKLSFVKIANKKVMFRLMRITFLKEPALLNFMNVVLDKIAYSNHAVSLFESPFLDERVKRVYDDIWTSPSLSSVKSVRCPRSQEVTFEAVLNDVVA